MSHVVIRKGFIAITFLLLSLSAQAAPQKLVINAVIWSLGAFHRQDNKVHPYSEKNVWKDMVLPDGANFQNLDGPIHNPDGSYTFFFSALNELFSQALGLSEKTHLPISVLNIHAHGVPGGQWFPKDLDDLFSSYDCADWMRAENKPDTEIYKDYYSWPTTDGIKHDHELGNLTSPAYPCSSGLQEWKDVLSGIADVKKTFASDAQINFLSCDVGIGTKGEKFLLGVASLLFNPENSSPRIQAAMEAGLADWSMEKGMGFFDYQNEAQYERDVKLNEAEKRDASIAQPGLLRVVTTVDGKFVSTVVNSTILEVPD